MSFRIICSSKKPAFSVEKTSHTSISRDELVIAGTSIVDDETSSDAGVLLCCLYRQLSSLLECKATERKVIKQNDALEPSSAPIVWISKWAKSSQKNGFCYELSDRSVGILFDDQTQFILDSKAHKGTFRSVYPNFP